MARTLRPPKRRVSGDTQLDMLEGSWVEFADTGNSAVRVAYVQNLTGSATAILAQALEAPSIPSIGTRHPSIVNCPLRRKRAELLPDHTDGAKVTLSYGTQQIGPGYFDYPADDEAVPRIEVATTVQSVRTSFDSSGQPIVLSHTYIIEDPETGTSTEKTVEQRGQVDYFLPMTVVRFFRRETRSPGDKSKLYTRKLNLLPVFGDPKHYWMCTKLAGVSDDRGVSYNVTYEFQRHPESWNPQVVFIDPITHLPPADLVPDVGIKTVQVMQDIDFEGMKLYI